MFKLIACFYIWSSLVCQVDGPMTYRECIKERHIAQQFKKYKDIHTPHIQYLKCEKIKK